jgi:hypothetical protein
MAKQVYFSFHCYIRLDASKLDTKRPLKPIHFFLPEYRGQFGKKDALETDFWTKTRQTNGELVTKGTQRNIATHIPRRVDFGHVSDCAQSRGSW